MPIQAGDRGLPPAAQDHGSKRGAATILPVALDVAAVV